MRIAFFPGVEEHTGNPYWAMLRDGLAAQGVQVLRSSEAELSLAWLIRNRGQVEVLHFHFVQQFYAYNTHYARLRWVLRFARNLLAARCLGYRTVFTFHNLTPTYPLKPQWVDYLGHLLAAQLTSSVIVMCQEARRLLAQRYGRHARVVIAPHPNFVDCYPNEIDRDSARRLLKLKPTEKTLLFLGGLRPNKGVEQLLHAFRQIQGVDLRLLVAGETQELLDAPYIAQLRHLAQQDARIRLDTRYIPDDEIQIFMNAADLVVIPFTRILNSGSAMLAMSFGKAVVVPAMGCLPELVGAEAGFLYDPDRPSALLHAIRGALTEDLTAIGARARARAKTFSLRSHAQQTLRAYGTS
ncbi:MAG: glycosyltransferase family 4 protein [Chloroflexota bacterium]